MDPFELDDEALGEVVDVNLTDEQSQLLVQGLVQWGGPAQSTDALARVLGFSDRADLFARGDRIRGDLRAGRGLSRMDWFRALAATEFVFASDTYGAGVDWDIVTGLTDEATVVLLREIQRELVGITAPVRAAIRKAERG